MSYTLVIPAAGRATRAMAFTGYGATPKPFVSVGGKTVFGLILEEARAAGVQDLAIIVSHEEATEVFRRYFDPFAGDLESLAATRLKAPAAIALLKLDQDMQVRYVIQEEPLGFGHAVGLVFPEIEASEHEGVLIALGDDLVCGGPSGLQQLIEVHKEVGGMVFMVEEVTREEASKFGVAQVSARLPFQGACRAAFTVESVDEKPQNPIPNLIDGQERYFAVAGRYLLEKEDVEFLYRAQPSRGKELDFSPLFARNTRAGRLTAVLPQGRFRTVGNASDLQKASISFALQSFREDPKHDLIQHTIEELLELGAIQVDGTRLKLHDSLQQALSGRLTESKKDG